MGLQHDFMCFQSDRVTYLDCTEYDYITGLAKGTFVNDKTCAYVNIHDDLVRYMYKNLAWIPCIRLSGKKYKKCIGINPNGSQIINHEGGHIFKKIISLWSELFSQSTETFKIRKGHYIGCNSKDFLGEEWEYVIYRDDLIRSLKILEEFADLTISGSHYILYWGI